MVSEAFKLAAGPAEWVAIFGTVKVGSPARKALYHAYLQSRAWNLKRAEAMQRSGGCCERCGNAEGNEVHHRTYARLGDELSDDLACVCRKCHSRQHTKPEYALEDLMANGGRAEQLEPGSGHRIKSA